MIETEEQARAFVAARSDRSAIGKLERLADMLSQENAAQNLIAASTLPNVWQRHIADSAQLVDYCADANDLRWLDIGSGAGFPGIVIAILRPQWSITLVEPRGRRVEWLERCIISLGLGNCRVESSKIEAVKPFHAGVISARAVASLDKLIALGMRFSTSDTLWLLPKGRSAAQELARLPKRTQELFHVEQSATDPEAGIVVGTGLEAKAP